MKISARTVWFYHINGDLYPELWSIKKILENHISDLAAIVLINYFGLLDLSGIAGLIKKLDPRLLVIIDDVQNYYGFRPHLQRDFDYAFTSLRKWFEVPDGAIVHSRNGERFSWPKRGEDYNTFAQYKLAGNLLKNFSDLLDDKICLELIDLGETMLEKEFGCKPSKAGIQIFVNIDVAGYGEIRRRNARILHKGLSEMGICHCYREDVVPMFIPIFLDQHRDEVRKRMFEKEVFCPIHWPWESEELNGRNILYNKELSLICDQRYTEEDMDFILEIIKSEYQYKK